MSKTYDHLHSIWAKLRRMTEWRDGLSAEVLMCRKEIDRLKEELEFEKDRASQNINAVEQVADKLKEEIKERKEKNIS